MRKDFDTWNLVKKSKHENEKYKLYNTRDIWWCALGMNVGFEQDGTGENFERPIIVLRGFSKHVCLIVPLTTSRKKNPYHISVGIVDGKKAFAIISQIRLIDTKRLSNKVGKIPIDVFKSIRKAVKELL